MRSSLYLVFGRPCFLVQSLGVHSVALMGQRLSDSRATWPVHLCFAFLIALIISLTPVSWRIRVFRFRSRRVMPSIMCSILRCATVGLSIIALFTAYVSQPYVINGKMYSSCIFLFILMLALRLLRMLSTSPTLPNQVRSSSQSQEAGHHISSPSFLGIRNYRPPWCFLH